MVAPLDRNRLADEPSPYLQQHAENPVHWQPWDDIAHTGASDRDVPIFCSIGYAACHWCHVMEEESFEDERVAERLNANFIPIKVDREERPDVDRIYQTICQLVSGSGGWPLSVFLTPDGRPFHVGTYFPPTSKRGQPGFIDILDRIHSSWESDREAIEDRADQWQHAIQQEVEVTTGRDAEPDTEPVLRDVARAVLRSADTEYGGFGNSGPKFPQPQRIEALLRADSRLNDDAYRSVATTALFAMADRGLYDHLGGGFHRYATDREWRIPHFEKMLYDNAELPGAYLAAYQLTDQQRFATVTTETLAFVTRELQHSAGGLYSTLDAQSNGEEGAYYVWEREEVARSIDDDQRVDLLCDRYGITPGGNFDGGRTVLSLMESVESLANAHEITEQTVRDQLAEGRRELLAARSTRQRPARDEKILAGWNGLMISTFAEAGLVLDPTWLDPARDALSFIQDELWDGRLSRRYKAGDVGIPGYLDDYAYVARGAIDLYQATGTFEWLEFAVALADVIVEEFWDASEETLYFTPTSGESLVSRPQDPYDQSTPSSLAVGLEVLSILDTFVPTRGFDEMVHSTLDTYEAAIAGAPLQHIGLALVRDRVAAGPLEWTIVAEDIPEEWRDVIAATYSPDRLIARRPPDKQTLESWVARLGGEEIPPIWRDRTQQSDMPTVYLCRDYTCSAPLTDPADAATWIDQLGPVATD